MFKYCFIFSTVPALNDGPNEKGRMSAADEDSRIDILISAAQLKKKLKKAFCEQGNVSNNCVIAFAKHILIPSHETNGTTNLC